MVTEYCGLCIWDEKWEKRDCTCTTEKKAITEGNKMPREKKFGLSKYIKYKGDKFGYIGRKLVFNRTMSK